jgi:Circadian oscillating protein COP23
MQANYLIRLGSITCAIAAIQLTGLPALAQTEKVAFYCGRTTDGSLNPATILGVSGRRSDEHKTIVIWRKTIDKITPEQRCEMVTKRFQSAWNKGEFNHLVAGINSKTGQGLICAVRERNGSCDLTKMLFSVKNQQSAREIVQGLYDSLQKTGNPTYQSSSSESIDMKELINGRVSIEFFR